MADLGCQAIACRKPVMGTSFLCGKHWRQLSDDLQKAVYATRFYKGAKYQKVIADCIDFLGEDYVVEKRSNYDHYTYICKICSAIILTCECAIGTLQRIECSVCQKLGIL